MVATRMRLGRDPALLWYLRVSLRTATGPQGTCSSLSTFPVGESPTRVRDCSPELPAQAVHGPESFPGGCSFGARHFPFDRVDRWVNDWTLPQAVISVSCVLELSRRDLVVRARWSSTAVGRRTTLRSCGQSGHASWRRSRRRSKSGCRLPWREAALGSSAP